MMLEKRERRFYLSVRHSQRPQHRFAIHWSLPATIREFRISAPARHGRGVVPNRSIEKDKVECVGMPDLCSRGRATRSLLAVPGSPTVGEWRQLFLRQPDCRMKSCPSRKLSPILLTAVRGLATPNRIRANPPASRTSMATERRNSKGIDLSDPALACRSLGRGKPWTKPPDKDLDGGPDHCRRMIARPTTAQRRFDPQPIMDGSSAKSAEASGSPDSRAMLELAAGGRRRCLPATGTTACPSTKEVPPALTVLPMLMEAEIA